MFGVELRAWPAHAVAIAGAWLAALIAGGQVLASMPRGESVIIVASTAGLAALIRTSNLEGLWRWALVLTAFVATLATAGYAYLDWRGDARLYELLLPTGPLWASFAWLDRALSRRGW